MNGAKWVWVYKYNYSMRLNNHRRCYEQSSLQEKAVAGYGISVLVILSKPQPNLNTTVGFYMKITLQPPPPTHTNSMSAIYQLLLTWFWWNFKSRLLGTSRTDSNCHGDICPGNICLGDICPYQEDLSSYWSDFQQTLKVWSLDYV